MSLYQGDPRPMTGLLYGSGFNEYTKLPELVERRAYIDTADEGDNMLCAILYGIGIDNYIYILDIYYTIEPPEVTEPETAAMLIRNSIDECIIESNAGGRAFARNVEKELIKKKRPIIITPYYQKQNKESRIVTNAASIMRTVLFPENWAAKWPIFYEAISGFRKLYSANKLKDAPDALTGAYEHSGLSEVDDDIITAIV
jgi:predicted phage terminase large subunit-like protein